MSGLAARAALALLVAAPAAPAQASGDAPPAGERPERAAQDDVAAPRERVLEAQGREEARAALDRALRWLLTTQNPDGSWGTGLPDHLMELGFAHDTYYAWQVAAHGLAVKALLAAPPTEAREAALRRALEWLTTTRLPHRGADWDVDSTWGSLYGFDALVDAARDPRFADGPLAGAIRERAAAFLTDLARRQTPDGGWAYYDDPPFTARPTWATSFCTALVLPALIAARDELGWDVPEHLIAPATELVRRCELPNGAFAYDYRTIQRPHVGQSINSIEGSLGRIQVCNWALARAGLERVTPDRVEEGLEAFLEHHRFLDLARMRPIPHEGFFANAGYFYFFAHYYAAKAISLLPAEDREAWHRLLRPHLTRTLAADGSTSDFLTSVYMVTASTSYLALALAEGLEDG